MKPLTYLERLEEKEKAKDRGLEAEMKKVNGGGLK